MNKDPRTASELAATYESQIKGKIVLTTGVSPGGIGAAFVLGIAQSQPALLILAGRNLAKIQQTADAISATGVKVRILELDLVSLASVRASAEKVNAWDDVPQIDVLVNNASVMAVDWARSPEGYDSQLAINYLGPFLFTNLIMGKMLKSPAPRVIIVTSDAHRLSPFRFDDYNFRDGEYYHKWLSYGQSKTANMLMAISLAEKLGQRHKLSAFSVHPGLVQSNLSSHLKLFGEDDSDMIPMRDIDRVMGNGIGWAGFGAVLPCTPEVGANVYVYGAFDPEVAAHNGCYLLSCRVADPWKDTVRPWATSSVEAERLWKLSEKLVGQEFVY
ncbi:NAD(P)-binding protein [Annulohypoxylon truncatum]|uniref:NAD(P)-binding protein n=1 Tax=Annulohypoxylon truncatum TaxID=327061 RepID=UPI00200861BD|nr:NAD(P)-binding protein [Annulohypoxylon truncatum]KAI1209552.1 NAD(P)-binding protein [Annulohypoxylon truncatum]